MRSTQKCAGEARDFAQWGFSSRAPLVSLIAAYDSIMLRQRVQPSPSEDCLLGFAFMG